MFASIALFALPLLAIAAPIKRDSMSSGTSLMSNSNSGSSSISVAPMQSMSDAMTMPMATTTLAAAGMSSVMSSMPSPTDDCADEQNPPTVFAINAVSMAVNSPAAVATSSPAMVGMSNATKSAVTMPASSSTMVNAASTMNNADDCNETDEGSSIVLMEEVSSTSKASSAAASTISPKAALISAATKTSASAISIDASSSSMVDAHQQAPGGYSYKSDTPIDKAVIPQASSTAAASVGLPGQISEQQELDDIKKILSSIAAELATMT